ncbi:MAG: SDR family oxidoreductase [Planctomycetota bacterium]|nr:SDR family oxidoreductase [Planctomycetota bacterium]
MTNSTRREFLQTGALATAALGLGSVASPSRSTPIPQDDSTPTGSSNPLKILILGGTRFLGPAIVEAAMAHGHEITLFNRGRSNPHLFPDLEKLVGNRDPDRDAGLETLKGRSWDAVVDTSGYVPRHVNASATQLAQNVKHYVFISTTSVYADPSDLKLDENSPVGTLADVSIEEVVDDTWGPLKALCEKSANAAMPGRVTNIRPGLIVGPRDPTDRFTYWPVRIARGGEVLAPGDGNDPVQLIDVRDLATYCIHCIEQNVMGLYNVVGPECPFLMAELVHGCKAITGGCVNFTWVPTSFLTQQRVTGWTDMPTWIPAGSESAGISMIGNAKAIARGLTFRPFAETALDTLDWFRTLPQDRQSNVRGGINPERELQVLNAWKTTRGL